MTRATDQLDTIRIPGKDVIWQFVLARNEGDAFQRTVFPKGVSRAGIVKKCSVGTDRILQKTVEALGFQGHVFIVRAESSVGRAPLDVIFSPTEFSDEIRSKIDPLPDRQGSVVTLAKHGLKTPVSVADGYTTFNVWAIHKYVTEKLEAEGLSQKGLLDLNDTAKIWKGLTGNIKSTVYDWMRRGPVFKPAAPVKQRDPAGCRLDVADLVVIGLLHGLVSHGLVFRDFEGPKVAELVRAIP